jgi:alcohol dehydrogenase class IV
LPENGKEMDISFKFDPEVLIGADTLSAAGTICSRYGKRIMIAADHAMDSATINKLKEILEDSNIEAIVFDGIEENSTVDMSDNIVELTHAAHCNAIIGFGGNKTQIITRMAAIMMPMRITSFELLEGRMFQGRFLPLVSIPTEGLDAFSLTNFFIAADPRNRLVKSVQSPESLFSAVIIDSNLLIPPSGTNPVMFLFDGFISAVEAYCSVKANFLSDALLERAINFFAKLLRSGGTNADTYAQACFLAAIGNAISSPGIGSALSYAINARFPVQKQQCSAVLLPYIMEKLVSARPEKMARVASFLGSAGKTGSVAEAANSAITGIQNCMETFSIKGDLKEFNIPLDRVTAAVEAARSLEFVANSPWTVSHEDAFEILRKII